MPATSTDRLQGVLTSTAVKAPCKAATTTALTLNGEQTVGGVACVSGDRVLVAITGGSVNNGIWIVDTGGWTRAKDFDGSRDVVKGTLVLVAPGPSARFWQVTSGVNVIGSAVMVFEPLDYSATGAADSAIIVQQPIAGAVARTQHDKNQELYSAKDFGVTGDGSTADSAKLTIAIANYPGGDLHLPAGTYKLDAPIITTRSNVRLVGAGRGATVLQCTFATGDIITFGDGTANPNNCGVFDLSITSTVAKSSGAAVRFRNGHNMRASGIRLDANLYRGFQFDGGAQQFIYWLSDFEINSGTTGIIAGEDGTLVQDLWISDGIIAGSTSDGFMLRHVSGFYFDAIDLLGCKNAFSTFPDTGKQVVAGLCSKIICDSSTQNGYNILTNGGSVADITFENSWASSNGSANVSSVTNNGWYFAPGAGAINGIIANGGRCTNNKGAGVKIDGGSNIEFSAHQVFSNSTVGLASRSGYEIAAGVSNWAIKGGSAGIGGLFGGGNNQKYGIDIAVGSGNLYTIQGVNVSGNQTGPINNGATGAARSVLGNPGYVNANRGVAQLNSGSSTVVVPHGLNVTPAQSDVITVPTVDINAGGVARWWVSAVSATNFTISVNTAATANLFFAWDIRTAGAQT